MEEKHKKLVEELLFSEEKSPSFAKKIFFGSFETKGVLPYPVGNREEDAFIRKVEAFAKENIDGAAIDRSSAIPDKVIEGLAHLGVLGMTVPKEFGGLGMSQTAYCRVCQIIARQCGSTALFVNAHQSIGLKALLLFGTDAQKKRWLTPLARGEALAAFSLTEPNAGSDAAGIETRATWIEEKQVWKIEGQKQWTTNGSIAKILTVMAKTDEKVTAFLITPDMPGFRVLNPALEKVGMRGTKTANLAFDGVEVPKENILGPIGGGLRVCLTVLDYGRTTFGATCTGSAEVAVRMAIEHAKTRVQFGKPLAAFPLIKRKIALMSALLYAMEAATYLTAGLIDQGIEDFMLESAILKVFTSESLWTILYESMQVFGGKSFFTDLPLERMMRDARLNMIGEGANEVMRAFIGAVGMRDVGKDMQTTMEAAKTPFDKSGTLWNASKNLLGRLASPTIKIDNPCLSHSVKLLSKATKNLGWNVLTLLGRYREEIVEKQFDLDRIATQAIAIYTATAVLSRTEKSNDDKEIALANYFCAYILQDPEGWGDEATEKLSDLLTSARP